MNIPGLGHLSKDERYGWHSSAPVPLDLLKGVLCQVTVEGYEEDANPADFHSAIANLLSCPFSALQTVEHHLYRYYQEMNSHWTLVDDEFVAIDSPSEIWRHIQIGSQLYVSRRAYGDKKIYVSIECSCDWEPEHGLQIVLKEGNQVTKVGPYDGHLSNADAFDDEGLEHVIYKLF